MAETAPHSHSEEGRETQTLSQFVALHFDAKTQRRLDMAPMKTDDSEYV